MSRIEMAMEKAARLREGKVGAQSSPAGEAALVEPVVAEAPPFSAAKGRAVSPDNPFLIHLRDPSSDIAEEYRKLKLALLEIFRGEHAFGKSVLITSSVSGEGKSITALNLAISLGQDIDHGVVLVDADLRRPMLHNYLGLQGGVGLSDLLLDKTLLTEAVIDTGLGKLSVIRAGTAINNPVELFSSAKMTTLVQQLKRAYPDRLLIFDTPPVLPFGETRSLARLMDGVLFVVMERRASQANVQESMESLVGCRIFGTVYNGAMGATHDERYSHYQDYYRSARQHAAIAESADNTSAKPFVSS